MSVKPTPRPKRSPTQTQLELYAATIPNTVAPKQPRKQATRHTDVAPTAQSDLFTHPLPPPPRNHLKPQDIRLTSIPIGLLSSAQEKGQWLYFATTEPAATDYLTKGIVLSRTNPLLLTTLNGMQAWLAKLHEQEDPEHVETLCIMRLHKTMVAELLEPEPDQSTLLSAPFFWLKKH